MCSILVVKIQIYPEQLIEHKHFNIIIFFFKSSSFFFFWSKIIIIVFFGPKNHHLKLPRWYVLGPLGLWALDKKICFMMGGLTIDQKLWWVVSQLLMSGDGTWHYLKILIPNYPLTISPSLFPLRFSFALPSFSQNRGMNFFKKQ